MGRFVPAAELDDAIGPALGQVGGEVDPQVAQRRQVLAPLRVAAGLETLAEVGLEVRLLALEGQAGFAIAQLGLLLPAGELEVVLDLAGLLVSALAGALELAVEAEALEVLLLDMLSKAPEFRPADAGEVATRLAAAVPNVAASGFPSTIN